MNKKNKKYNFSFLLITLFLAIYYRKKYLIF